MPYRDLFARFKGSALLLKYVSGNSGRTSKKPAWSDLLKVDYQNDVSLFEWNAKLNSRDGSALRTGQRICQSYADEG